MDFITKNAWCKIILSISLVAPSMARANNTYIHPFETTRLKSTAGAGAASLLVEESTVLNPASIAFFNLSSIYVQKAGVEKLTNNQNESKETKDDQIGVIISDSNPTLSGSFSYLNHGEGDARRKRFALSTASTIGKSSSLGAAIRRTEDRFFSQGSEINKEKYTQLVFGVTHAVNESFSFGAFVTDPQRKKKTDSTYTLGMQYVYANFLTLMADAGAPFSKKGSSEIFYKLASQFRILDDFFFRVGTFNDKFLDEKGNGLGAGWIQPKLSIEVSYKNTRSSEKIEISRSSSSIKETSFSLSYRF